MYSSKLALISKWLTISMVAWMIPPFVVGFHHIISWTEWRSLLAAYGLNGAVIGTIVGLGHARVLGATQVPWRRWVVVTLTAYAVGLAVGFGLASAVAFWRWPVGLPMLEGLPGTQMVIGLYHAAPYAGAVIGLAQWLMLRNQVVPATGRAGIIWTLSSVCGLTLGAFVAMIIDELTFAGIFPLSIGHLVARFSVGVCLGLFTGIALVTLRPPVQPEGLRLVRGSPGPDQ